MFTRVSGQSVAPCPGDAALPHIHFQVFLRVCVRTCLPFTAGVGATAQAADFPDAALYCQGSCMEGIIFLDFEFNCQNAIVYYLFFFKIVISK